jgi:hypothetical protein
VCLCGGCGCQMTENVVPSDRSMVRAWYYLMSAMAGGGTPGMKVATWDFVLQNGPSFESDPYMSPAALVHFLDRAKRELDKNVRMFLEDPPDEFHTARNLQASLRLVESTICSAILDDAEMDAINEVLSRLLALLEHSEKLDIDVKGALFRAMAAFAPHPMLSRQIWDYLDGISVLPDSDVRLEPPLSTDMPSGLAKELEENERRVQRRYPLTEGFLT